MNENKTNINWLVKIYSSNFANPYKIMEKQESTSNIFS